VSNEKKSIMRVAMAGILFSLPACDGGRGRGSGGDTGGEDDGGGSPIDGGAAAADADSHDAGGAPGSDARGGVPGDPATIFDPARLHALELSLAPDDWQSILDDSRGNEWRRATFSFDGGVIDNVGVRPSGESSRFSGNRKMSLRLKFDAFGQDGRKLHGVEELKLEGLWSDASLMRERLAYFVFHARMPSPREVHGRLVVNGELRGLYGVEEVWDDEAVKARFAAPIGPLYRVRGLSVDLDPYAYLGDEPSHYVPLPWDPETKHLADEHVVIGRFLRALAQMPDSLDQVADVERLLEYFACSAVVTNIDGFTGDFEVDDHFQYFDTQTGRFVILPWDPDNTFGSINDPPTRSIYENFSKSALTRLIRDTPALRRRMRAKINEIMAAIPLPKLSAEADFIYRQIQAAAYEDPYKTWPNDHFDFSLGYIKQFAADRYTNLQMQVNPK